MKLSVVIVSWNVRRELLACLKSLQDNHPAYSFEIIVVDNAGSDGTVEAVKRQFPVVKVIGNTHNYGFSAANNQAIKIAAGEYIFLLNPDTIVCPGSLDILVKSLNENPSVGICGPRILNDDGSICPSIGFVPTFRSLLYSRTILRSLGIFRYHYKKLNRSCRNTDKPAMVAQLSGAAIMIRKAVFEQTGLMDDNFFMYYEDTDLCLRARNTGWQILYQPKAVITHIGGKSSEQISAEKQMLLYRSLFIFFRKHRGRVRTCLFELIFKPGVILKEIAILAGCPVGLVFFILFNDTRRRQKTLSKIKNSWSFLSKRLFQFLFKTGFMANNPRPVPE